MTRYAYPILIIILLAAIAYLIVAYNLWWCVSAFTRAGGAS